MLAQTIETLEDWSPVRVSGAVQFDLTSAVNERAYRICVFEPASAPPPMGYPVIFVLDGALTFPLAATISGSHALRGGKAALVVGIGYPANDPVTPFMLRTRDLTPPTPAEAIRPWPGMSAARPEDVGGSADFFRFLTEELRPLIEADYHVDTIDQTLYGHSLAGLFTLETLFKHPRSFRTFVASSPSIWWNGRAVLADEASFKGKVAAGEASPRVLILVGAREWEAPETPPANMTRAELSAVMAQSRMVDNAAELAARLERIDGGPGYEARFHAFDGEDHLTVLPGSVSRAVAFALKS